MQGWRRTRASISTSEHRPKNITLPLVIVLAVLANNLVWLYLTRNMQPQIGEDHPVVVQPANPKSHLYSGNRSPREPAPARTVHSPAGSADRVNDANGSSTLAPEGTAIQGTDIPMALSEAVLFERQMDLKNFFQANTTRKLQTIETLSPQGEALGLLRRILQIEADDGVRIAALNRLKQGQNYVATTLLIDALEDPAADVSVAAVQALAATGDRTLLPLLKEKLASLPNGSIRDQYAQSIRQLEYSVTMAMDGAPAP